MTTPGTYTASIVIRSLSAASAPELRIPVILNVSSSTTLRTDANLVAFHYQLGGSVPAVQKLSVNATGNPVGFHPAVQTSDGRTWLNVTPDFGTTPVEVNISVDPAGLAAGTYTGVITLTDVSTGGQTHYVPVTLQVSSGPALTVPSQPLVFRGTVGGPTMLPAVVKVSSAGAPAQITATPGSAGWLQVTPTAAFDKVDLSVQATQTGFSAGYHLGLLTIRIPGVDGSEQYVPVAMALGNPAQ